MIVLGIILLAFGGVALPVWGIFLRTVVGLHSTWLVNSATHMWGSRRFTTRDLSTNNFWVALADLRRRLAQQPPRPSGFRPPWPELVRN